jgi:site-specific recombinase XerC
MTTSSTTLPTTLPTATTGEEEDNIHQQHLQLEIQEVLNERAAILQKATMHVQQVIIQRKLANAKIQQSIDSSHLPHSERHYFS